MIPASTLINFKDYKYILKSLEPFPHALLISFHLQPKPKLPKMMIPTLYYDFFNPGSPPQQVYIRVDKHPPQTSDLMEQWPVNKILTARDLNCSQVVMPRDQVEECILPHLLPDQQNSVNHGEPLQITVRDLDTLTEHRLRLWDNGSSSYVLTSGWSSAFIWRRGLKVGEAVGFCWDQRLRMLRFSVLNRPPVPLEEYGLEMRCGKQ